MEEQTKQKLQETIQKVEGLKAKTEKIKKHTLKNFGKRIAE